MPIVSTDRRFADLIRTGRIHGHDARPEDYDNILAECAQVHAWACKCGLDKVAAMASGMMAAVLTIDPRRTPPF